MVIEHNAAFIIIACPPTISSGSIEQLVMPSSSSL